MNFYRLLKIYQKIKSPKLKLLGILALHVSGRRYINIFMDPAMACNLRCRMCYFSDPESLKNIHGTFSDADIQAIAKSLFPRAMKLQIGCGAEPTTFKGLDRLVSLGKQHGVPFISMTTNGNLLTMEKLEKLVDCGLNEMTISAHGFTKPTYEDMMRGGQFDKFILLVDCLRQIRIKHPDFNIRVNYTINEDNVEELILFRDVFKDVSPNVLQIRPVQKIGESSYSNFSLDKIDANHERLITPVVDYCHEKGIICIYPTRDNLRQLAEEEQQHPDPCNSAIDLLAYFHVAPYDGWKNKFDPYKETFDDYCRRTHRLCFIMRNLFNFGKKEIRYDSMTKNLHYDIK